MTRCAAFLRAINVGGHIVRMDRLRALCTEVPLANVATVIASGNVLFDTRRTPAAVEAAIEKRLRTALGYDVAAMVRPLAEVAAVVQHVETHGLAPAEGVVLYVGFLKSIPSRAAGRAVADLSNDIDQLSIEGREVYWRCARSFSQSTVSGSRLEKILAVPATFRNFNTVRRIGAMGDAQP